MPEKFATILDFLKKRKTIVRLFIVFTIINTTCLYATMEIKNLWNNFSYPEKEYYLLEVEAEKMVNSNDYSTEYEFVNTNQDDNDLLSFKLSEGKATISVNYNKEKNAFTIERKLTKTQHTILLIVMGICLIAQLDAWQYVFIYIGVNLLGVFLRSIPK